MQDYVLLIGAYERDNFGDLLFAKIFDRVLAPFQTIKGSLMGRDLTNIGGDTVVSAQNCIQALQQSPLAAIHCGGETLACSKTLGVNFDLSPDFFNQVHAGYMPHQDEIAQKLTSSSNSLAYVYNHADLGAEKDSFPIAFFSVGGSALSSLPIDSPLIKDVKNRLDSAQFISVRDTVTLQNLKSLFGIEAELSPDVVTIVSRTHQAEVKKAAQKPGIKEIVEGQPYFLFQSNQTIINTYRIVTFAQQLGQLAQKYNKAVVLQPAGVCYGQDLIEQFKAIADVMKKQFPEVSVTVQEDRNIWSQVAVIAHADCSIATSLHVRVVSCAFARPCISLPNDKVATYVSSWNMGDGTYNVEPQDLDQAVESALQRNPDDYVRLAQYLGDQVVAGLQNLKAALHLNTQEVEVKHHKQIQENLLTSHFATLSLELDQLREIIAKEVISYHKLELEIKNVLQPMRTTKQVPVIHTSQLEAENKELKNIVHNLTSSTSWRVTAPLRRSTEVAKNVLNITRKLNRASTPQMKYPMRISL
jgi:polysaccharide pyruvyl transferase WcaK-like protein